MILEGKPHSDEEILDTLHPLVREWFLSKYSTFTPPQKYSIVEAFKGNNVLISSPTGSGKTLAAFLTSLSLLIEKAEKKELEKRVYALYVSPLRALNNDIRRNLEEPLEEIYQLAEEKGIKLQNIRIGVRTGDTESREKQKQLRNPPHILITTPETLSIVLASPKFIEKLTRIKFFIVDEIHSVAENKRGSHLSLSLERVKRIQEEDSTRIGLSATIAPLNEIAQFLVGNDDDCIVTDVTFEKSLDIKVTSPIENFFEITGEEIGQTLYSILADHVRQSRTVLIFTNTRSATERVVYNLKKELGENFPVSAHHSSLSREVRLEVEEEMKQGNLRCVVSSTSLELGIDIGHIDLVVLLGSPKSINRAIQRIGRSGHRLVDVSRGRIVVLDQDDLVECTVLAREALDRKLDRIEIPQKPLDVLVQHVVGMAIERRWNVDEALSLTRNAYPYRNLTKQEFLDVLRYLAGHSELERKKVYGKIWFDEEEQVFGRRGKLIRPIYYLNTGTIPDEVAISVITRDKKRVGKVEEEFAEKLLKGDIFVLGGNTFRFLKSQGTKLVVESAEGEKPTVPSWFSEQLPLSYDLGHRIQEFRRLIDEMLEDGDEGAAVDYLVEEYNLEENAARAILGYFREQKMFSDIPTDEKLLVEKFEDEGRHNYVFHTLIGRRANSAISRVFAYRAGMMKGCNVQIALNDNGFMLMLPRTMTNDEITELFDENDFEEHLKRSLDRTELLRRRFRHVAVRSMMILRNYLGREKSVWRQQLSSDSILNLLKRDFPDFPVLKETHREIMEDSMDSKNALDYLFRVGNGIDTVVNRVPYPSPFAFNIYVLGKEDVVLMEDRRKVLKALHDRIMSIIAQ